jgi:hypothetical protein
MASDWLVKKTLTPTFSRLSPGEPYQEIGIGP